MISFPNWYEMTLPNFDWTDKKSVKWFIMHPTGHVGPYSISALEHYLSQGKIELETKIWTEGLEDPVTLRRVLEEKPAPVPVPEHEIPPLPPIPDEKSPNEPHSEVAQISKSPSGLYPYVFGAVVLSLITLFTLSEVLKTKEKVMIRRHPKMSPTLHQRILKELDFEGWNKNLFFKEYVSPDLSHIWLVTSGFQKCQVETVFTSMPDKLLAMKDEAISFKSHGKLTEHVVELSNYEFISGNKVRPGMYAMNVSASNCQWDGVIPRLANWFKSPQPSYQATMNVILFSQGAREFNLILDNLVRKKIDVQAVNQSKEEAFWQDLQQKLQTLLALSLQIEQMLLDFLDQAKPLSPASVKVLVDNYTKKYGHFLTNFVVANEESFKQMNISEMKDPSKKRNYELVIRITSKNIGFEAMRIIENLQALRSRPGNNQIPLLKAKVKNSFSDLKKQINQKIIQISEDRSK